MRLYGYVEGLREITYKTSVETAENDVQPLYNNNNIYYMNGCYDPLGGSRRVWTTYSSVCYAGWFFSCELLRKYTFTFLTFLNVMADEICHRKFEEKK